MRGIQNFRVESGRIIILEGGQWRTVYDVGENEVGGLGGKEEWDKKGWVEMVRWVGCCLKDFRSLESEFDFNLNLLCDFE